MSVCTTFCDRSLNLLEGTYLCPSKCELEFDNVFRKVRCSLILYDIAREGLSHNNITILAKLGICWTVGFPMLSSSKLFHHPTLFCCPLIISCLVVVNIATDSHWNIQLSHHTSVNMACSIIHQVTCSLVYRTSNPISHEIRTSVIMKLSASVTELLTEWDLIGGTHSIDVM